MWEWCCFITTTLYVYFVDQCHPYILLISMKSLLVLYTQLLTDMVLCIGQVEKYSDALASTRLVLQADPNNVKALYCSGKVSVVVVGMVAIVCEYCVHCAGVAD